MTVFLLLKVFRFLTSKRVKLECVNLHENM